MGCEMEVFDVRCEVLWCQCCLWCGLFFFWHFSYQSNAGDSFLYKAMNVNRPKHVAFYESCMSGDLPEVISSLFHPL